MGPRNGCAIPQAYTRALDMDAENGEHFNKRGEVYQQLGEHDKVTTMHTPHSYPLEDDTWRVLRSSGSEPSLPPRPAALGACDRTSPCRARPAPCRGVEGYRADGCVHTRGRDGIPLPYHKPTRCTLRSFHVVLKVVMCLVAGLSSRGATDTGSGTIPMPGDR
jgi:hypothetical protein